MASIVRTYNFVNGNVADAEEVDTELNAIVAFITAGGSVVHVDGTQAFTGIPVLPVTSPTLGTHAASKSYVDTKIGPSTYFGTGTSELDGVSAVGFSPYGSSGTIVTPAVNYTMHVQAQGYGEGNAGSTTFSTRVIGRASDNITYGGRGSGGALKMSLGNGEFTPYVLWGKADYNAGQNAAFTLEGFVVGAQALLQWNWRVDILPR